MTDDFANLDATAQADLVRTGEVSPLELVDAAINRVEKLNPQLNPGSIRASSRPASRRPLPDGPFTGVRSCSRTWVARSRG
jgi:amidase